MTFVATLISNPAASSLDAAAIGKEDNWEDRGSKLFAEGEYGDSLDRRGQRR
jgi:hypothetical protein